MTPLRITQSSQDWRKTHVAFAHRPRRYHSVHIHGPLQPMSEDRSGKWCKWLCLVLAGYFAIQLIGGVL